MLTVEQIKELQERRGTLANSIQALADNQANWSAEDRANWDQMNADYNEVIEQIDAFNLADEVEQRRKQLQEDNERLTRPGSTRPGIVQSQFGPQGITAETRALALQAWMCNVNGLQVEQRAAEAARACKLDWREKEIDVKIEMRSPMSGFQMFSCQSGRLDWSGFEERAQLRDKFEERQMNTTTPGEGAEFIPQLFVYELERAMMAFGGLRRVARLFPTGGGNPMHWPTVNDLANIAVIVGENADVGANTIPTTGEIIFGAYKYTSLPVLVSEEMIQDSAFNLAALLGSLLGERIGRGQAVHLATGDGNTQPEGLTVGATVGFTAAAQTSISADELIDLQGSLDPAYEALPSVGFAMNKKTLTAVRKLKTQDQQYLWRPGLTLREPDLLLGSPYAVVQEMPDIAANAKPIAYGAMEKFVIRDCGQVRFYRLNELYRQNDQTGFLALHRMDSKVIQAEAIKLLQMAAP